ncbi:MAG: murein biosynthesis integral membrane protein MurJ [Planctomycetes bacterium]|nr:murein biosynthesis integral membrane protein MurJ [Planctomycetota bacterium]
MATKEQQTPMSGRGALRGALVTAVWTLFSRVLGFARDAVMLAIFGASAATGNFVIAWMVPNLFRRLFGEGAVSAAVQPALARARAEKGEEGARQLFARFQGLLLALLSVLVIGGELVVLAWHAWLVDAPLADGAKAAAARAADLEALKLTAWLLPYVLPICLTALASAPQQLGGRFSLPALAPAILNVIWISWLLVLGPGADILWLPAGVLVGGLAQWLLQWPGLRADHWPLLPRRPGRDPELRRTVRDFLPVMLGLAAIQLNLMVDQILVRELVSEDANSYTYAANRLLQLPMALVGISAATAAMPLFARLAAEGRRDELGTHLRNGTELTLLLMIAAGGGLFVLSAPVITVLFEHGRFTSADTEALTPVLQAYLWSLPAAALIGLTARACQACGNLRGPAQAAVAAIPINLGLDLVLLPQMGVVGAGYATAVALSFQFLLLARMLRALKLGEALRWARLPVLLLPGTAATSSAWAVTQLLGDQVETAWGVALSIGAGVLSASISAYFLLPDDFAQLATILRRRRGGS